MTTPHQRTHLRRPSISSRLSFAISTHSAETAREDAAGAQEHVEEIEEIRRYEVCPPFADRKRRGGGEWLTGAGFHHHRFGALFSTAAVRPLTVAVQIGSRMLHALSCNGESQGGIEMVSSVEAGAQPAGGGSCTNRMMPVRRGL